jgi:predicted permease
MDTLWQDIRYGFRMLVKERVVTLIAVLTLALGIGANTAIFSLFDQILLRKLPVNNPEELVVLYSPGPLQGRSTSDENRQGGSWSYPMYKDLRDKNQVFSGLLACFSVPVSVAAQNSTERAVGMIVSGNFFEVLGVRAAAGRLFTEEDDLRPGEHPVAVLSHDYWKRRFGSNPNIVNQSVIINGHSYTIIGVAQEGFYGVQIGRGRDVYLPIAMKAQVTPTWNGLDNRKDYWAKLIGRLKPGMTREHAEAGLLVTYKPLLETEAPLQKNFSKETLDRFVSKKIELADGAQGRQVLQADAGQPLKILMGMVGLVLLIACANVANLLIARSAGRQKEIAVRLSLGADRWRLMRQLLVESMMLALLGGCLGLLVATWTQAGLVQLLSADTSMSNLSSQLDARVLAFNFGLAILTALLFGFVPSLKASRPDLNTTLKDLGGSVSSGIAQVRFRKGLVVAQMALTVLLVVAAGLFAHSLYNLHQVELGVRTDRLVQFSIAPELNSYTPPRTIALFQQLEDSLSGLPGVDGVSASTIGAFEGNTWNSNVTVEGYEPKEGEDMHPSINSVAPRYFSTMGTPLLAGRDFTRQDAATAPKVVIINELFAKKWFAGRDPIGRKIAFGSGPGTKLEMEIVGVVKDFKHSGVRSNVRPFVFYPYMQDKNVGDITFYVRSQSDPQTLFSAVRREVQKLDANLPIYNLKTLEVQIQESLIGERVTTILSVAFGALAAMLAAIGVYGVMAYTVTRRTREIGIRMALGARHSDVRGMILREVARMAAIGIIVGLPASYGVGKLTESILYGVQPADILTAVAAVLLIAVVAFCAGFFPARRATQINPITALRYE